MSDKIPTVEEFISQYLDVDVDFVESMREQMSKLKGFDFNNIPDLMIEFAKLHVEAALKAAAEKGQVDFEPEDYDGSTAHINKESILSAYPLTNIQ